MLTTLKHFPGHGSSTGDSHQGFVDVTRHVVGDRAGAVPNIIRAGMCDAVMTAHIFNAHLDAAYPATLSQLTITGILRDQLGWDGVVITDDMGMGAITQHYGFERPSSWRSWRGPISWPTPSTAQIFDPTIPARAFRVIKGLVESGVIPESRIDQSYRRIMRLKERLMR